MSSETAVGFALGITGSVLFVISYIPQLRSIGHGDTTSVSVGMFALQLLSGGVWTTYGIIEGSVSVILFGALATILRLWIIRSLMCRPRQRSGTVLLAGGGDLPHSIWRTIASSSRRKKVVILSWAEENVVIAKQKEEFAKRQLLWAGCLSTTDTSNLEYETAFWMTGGNSKLLLKKLDDNPVLKKRLLELPHKGGFVGGTSAGAVVLGTKGIGLVPLDVCVHATHKSATHCIGDKTALVITDGVMRTMGRGGLSMRLRNVV